MLSKESLFLFATILAILIGFLLPSVADIFFPYVEIILMLTLFFNLFKVNLDEIKAVLKHPVFISTVSFVKLVFLPVTLYFLTYLIYPKFAVAVLLLTGTSVGVFAPFMSNLLGARTSVVVALVIVTSLLVPFTLPTIIYFLLAKETAISLSGMMLTLAKMIFIPIIAVWFFKKYLKTASKIITKNSFYFSLVLVLFLNSPVLGHYRDYFVNDLWNFWLVFIIASLFALVNLFLGHYILHKFVKEEFAISSSISMVFVNNGLMTAFASQYFGPLEASLAVIYSIPYNLMIFPAKWFFKRK